VFSGTKMNAIKKKLNGTTMKIAAFK